MSFLKKLNSIPKTYVILISLFLLGISFFASVFLDIISPEILKSSFEYFYIVYFVIKIIDIIAISLLIYNFVISLFGFINKDKKFNINKIEPINKFALIICAHNEKYVIENTLEEMEKVDYPTDKLELIVVCDNCSDNTFDLASKYKENYKYKLHVLKRTNNEQKGKPYAVKFGLNYINLRIPNYNAISIADADNVYHKDFFLEMNKKLNEGKDIVQGYLGVKNPYDSYVCSSNMIAYSAGARSYFMARETLGMSSALGGTGFILSKKILSIIPWNLKSLVEDFEYSVHAVKRGFKVNFAYFAKTYDEKPLPLKVSMGQRKRWMQGHWYVCFKNIKDILKRLFSFKKTNKLTELDYAIYLLSPGRMIIQIWLILSFLFIFPFITVSNDILYYYQIDNAIKISVFFLPIVQNYIFAIIEGFKWHKIFDVVYYYVVYSITYLPLTLRALFHWKEQGVWKKTEHKINVVAKNLN